MKSDYAASWFVCLKRKPTATMRLFCFPYAGGGPSVFASWADGVCDEVELWCASLPGRGARLAEPALRDPAQLLSSVLAELLPLLDRPFAFFGHSMGALISYELAQRLQINGRALPSHLWISGCLPPHLRAGRVPVEQMSDDEFIAYLGDLKGTPPALLLNGEFMQLMLPSLRADFLFCQNFRGSLHPALRSPLSVLGGRHDGLAPVEQLLDWRLGCLVEPSVAVFEGDHFFINSESDAVVRHVNAGIQKLLARSA